MKQLRAWKKTHLEAGWQVRRESRSGCGRGCRHGGALATRVAHLPCLSHAQPPAQGLAYTASCAYSALRAPEYSTTYAYSAGERCVCVCALQAAADAARFAALNQALASEPVAVPEPQQPAEPVEADVEMDRGRQGGSKKQKASKARRDILPVPVQAESEDMETDGVPTAGKKARAGSKGVQKRQGKKRLIGRAP